MDLRDSLSQDSQVSSLGSNSSLAQTIQQTQEQNITEYTRAQYNLHHSDPDGHNNGSVFHISSGVDSSVLSSAPANLTSEHSDTHIPVPRTACQFCHLQGLNDCNVLQGDRACLRCLLMGGACDLDSDGTSRRRGMVTWCMYCEATRRKCATNPDWCDKCLFCCDGECIVLYKPELKDTRSVSEGEDENEDDASSLLRGEGDTAPESSMHFGAVKCRGCGEKLSTAEDVTCPRCTDVMVRTVQAYSPSGRTPNILQVVLESDGRKVLNTCAGCFDRKLDPEATEIYCSVCKESLLRSVALKQNFRENERKRRQLAEQVKESIASASQPESSAELDSSDWFAELYPDLSWKPPTPTKWAFQPCISCQTNSFLCDHALPTCTQCKNTEKRCSYQYLTNPRRTEPVRFDEVPRTCFACREVNVKIQISGLCGPCDAKARLEENQMSTALSATTPISNTVASTSQIEESKSELPRFLASLQTRLEDVRLGHTPQQQPQPEVIPKVDAEAGSRPPKQVLIQLPPVLPSEETTTSPLPGFTTPCLDNITPCSTLLKPTSPSNPHPLSSIKPYRPLSIRSKHATPTQSNAQQPTLATATPCLACFDDTVCAYHLKSGWEEKAATACGGCRLAGLECDEVQPGCGECEERGVECLYIKGTVAGESEGVHAPEAAPKPEADPEPVPVPSSTSTTPKAQPPPPPRACGSCRLSEVPCDGTRPGCLICRDKGLECLYISGGAQSSQSTDEVSTFNAPFTQSKDDNKDEDEHEDKNDPSLNGLATSTILYLATEKLKAHSTSDFQYSNLDDSVILAVAGDTELETSITNTSEAVDSDLVERGQPTHPRNEELDGSSEGESDGWDVVSNNEEYEVIDTGRESDDGDEGSLVL
ncbi:hypothetical protein ONS96_001169 [Cadophora gregata f. sp. sojae]|nr:hypothetical protein ONS96_001169 [Cadophora gregata f. sp. sojae]